MLKAARLGCALALVFWAGSASALLAGASRIPMTPPAGVPLAGYADRLGRDSVDTNDPIWVRCVYIDDGDTKVFLLTSDLCYVNEELRAEVVSLAPIDVPGEQIILMASHNHNAPGGLDRNPVYRLGSGRFMERQFESVAQVFAQAMDEAYDSRRRATIGWGVGEETELTVNRSDEESGIDPQVGVVRVQDADGNPIAVLCVFAAQPASLSGPNHYTVSAGFPGFFYTYLESRLGGKAVAMFANGACGDVACAPLAAAEDNPQPTDWDSASAMGRRLAARVHEIAEEVDCREARLTLRTGTRTLPPSLADWFVAQEARLTTLEFDGMLMAFVPFVPSAAVGVELRRRATEEWGFSANMLVAPSNGYLFYMAPQPSFTTLHYEPAMSFFGPDAENWLYAQVQSVARERPLPPASYREAETPDEAGPVTHIRLEGPARERGQARGAALPFEIALAYEGHVQEPLRAGRWTPATGWWTWQPPFLDSTPFTRMALAVSCRPMLAGLTADSFDYLTGMAAGAELPFDGLWLLQCAAVLREFDDPAAVHRAPFCAMFAVVGGQAGADDLLVGRNLDWPVAEPPVLVESRPEAGHGFVQAGFAWNAGVFTGMNDAGLVAAVERVRSLGAPGIDAPPVEMVVRDLLETCGGLDEADALLRSFPALQGYHVLIADPAGPIARVYEFGDRLRTRETEEGLLLGCDPDSLRIDPSAVVRYERLEALLAGKRIIAAEDIETALHDQAEEATGQERIFNAETVHSVVFEPNLHRLRISVPDEEGAPGPYHPVRLAFTPEGADDEGEEEAAASGEEAEAGE